MPEAKFKPKKGQVDFTHARYAPVVNSVVTDGKKVLLVKRSDEMRLYPGYWNGISGFLDDKKSLEEKVREELWQELGIRTADVLEITPGRPFLQEAPQYSKTWIVVPVLANVKPTGYKLNWEAQEASWFTASEIKKLKLLPGFDNVIKQFFKL